MFPNFLGSCQARFSLPGFPARLDLPAVRQERLLEVAPDMLDRMEMVCLKPSMRKDRFDRFGEALGVIREGRGHLGDRGL
jgi:hypothetical protein